MSKIKSFRGIIADNAQDIISLHTNDGSTGYRIVKLQLISENPGQDTAEHVVKIYKTPQTSIDAIIDFSDNRLLGTAIYFGNSNPNYPQDTIIIFDGEVFNQDIYITHLEDNFNNPVNYYIELEQMSLDLNESTVATLKDIRNSPSGLA